MKKIFFVLFFVLGTLITNAQSYYSAFTTELYEYDSEKKEWVLNTKNSDTKIILVVEEDFITIQAKSPSMYKIFNETKEVIDTKTLKGARYDARDLKLDMGVKIDIIRFKDDSGYMISILNFTQKYNYRFYVVPMENK